MTIKRKPTAAVKQRPARIGKNKARLPYADPSEKTSPPHRLADALTDAPRFGGLFSLAPTSDQSEVPDPANPDDRPRGSIWTVRLPGETLH